MKLGPRTRYKESRLGQNTVSTVVPICTFLRIENRAKIKKTRILFEKLDFREKILKE